MSRIGLPQDAELKALLRLETDPLTGPMSQQLHRAVTVPLQQFLSRDGKALRAKVVEAGFRLGAPSHTLTDSDRKSCEGLASCIEAIHAGSLIVDDIQDGTQVRRGAATLHRAHGLPIALNAGNLLYFWGMNQIAAVGLAPTTELQCVRRLHEEILRAHYGQALDIGTATDELEQSAVPDLCLAAIRLKSGALMSLALTLGAIASGASAERLKRLDEFGHLLGMGLQMFDDLNNMAPAQLSDPNQAKRLEDLYLRRPSWVWAFAAKTFDARDYADFVRAVRMLPNESYLAAWTGVHDFSERARASARDFVENAFTAFEKDLTSDAGDSTAFKELRSVAERFGRPQAKMPSTNE